MAKDHNQLLDEVDKAAQEVGYAAEKLEDAKKTLAYVIREAYQAEPGLRPNVEDIADAARMSRMQVYRITKDEPRRQIRWYQQ